MHHLITGRNPAATPFNFPKITQCRPTLLEETPRELRNAVLGLEMIIDKCTQYEPEHRYQSCAELKYDLEHPEELGLPHRKKLKSKMIAFGACAGMSVILGAASLFGLLMENKTEQSGYDYYIDKAEVASTSEAIDLYRTAIKLNPKSEEAYLGMLDAMLWDNELSAEEDMVMMSALSSIESNRGQENETYLKNNEEGYTKFAYELGLAYYYSTSGSGDKSSAKGWFDIVANADMDSLDMGDDDSDKDAWQARSEILGKICEYSNKIGVVNQAGDAEVSYTDYWNDMMSLIGKDVASSDNVITELRLYNDIVMQIYEHIDDFYNAGLTTSEMVTAIDQIESSMNALNVSNAGSDQNLKQETQQIIDAARGVLSSDNRKNGEGGQN